MATTEKDLILRIEYDDAPRNPREWDNLGTIFNCSRHYDVGDEQAPRSYDDAFGTPAEMLAAHAGKNILALPVYAHDHGSGVNLTAGEPGQAPRANDPHHIGYVYVTLARVREEYHVRRVGRAVRRKAFAVLAGEIRTYSQYLQGDVYGFELVRPVQCSLGHTHEEEINACWDFYGSNPLENGMRAYITDDDWARIKEIRMPWGTTEAVA